jgi:hypothetical protein
LSTDQQSHLASDHNTWDSLKWSKLSTCINIEKNPKKIQQNSNTLFFKKCNFSRFLVFPEVVGGASKIKLKKMNKRTVTIRRVFVF